MAEVGNPQGQRQGIHRRQGRTFTGTGAAHNDRNPCKTKRHNGKGPNRGTGGRDQSPRQIGNGDHGQGVLEQEEEEQIKFLRRLEPAKKQLGPVIEEAL